MATLILKSLGVGFILTVIIAWVLGMTEGESFLIAFAMPFFVWPLTLGISFFACLVFLAIKENRN